VVVDGVGGETLKRSYPIVKKGGILVLRFFASQRLTRRQSRLNRPARVVTIMASIAGQ
jgi:NADPH:quinone reductase-like Zn-dependent oxidoreductase